MSSSGGGLSWPLTAPAGLGAVPQLKGPTDQPLLVATQANQNLTLSPNGTGKVLLSSKIGQINGTTTVALGVPAIVATSRVSAATTNQTGLLNFTVGASDSTFVVSANLLVTAYTSGTINVQVVFTDESNTVRTFTMPLMQGSGSTFSGSNAVACFAAVPHHLRCKAGTTISVQSSGTFVATFNLEAYLEQIG